MELILVPSKFMDFGIKQVPQNDPNVGLGFCGVCVNLSTVDEGAIVKQVPSKVES